MSEAFQEHETQGLRVLIADEDRRALDRLAGVLTDLGHDVVPYAVSVREAVERIANDDPQVAIVMVHRDDEHALALIDQAVEFASGPVIAQVATNDVDFITRAAERGITAYVDSIAAEPIQAAIEIAMRRYGESAGLSERVDQLEGALTRRGTIERAKGIVMERHGIGEEAAFSLLRGHARSQGRRVVDIAEAVSDGHALLLKP